MVIEGDFLMSWMGWNPAEPETASALRTCTLYSGLT